MSTHDEDRELTSQSGLDTLIDLRSEAASGSSSSVRAMAPIVFDPNRFRLDRMLQREHLVYSVPTPFLGRTEEQRRLEQLLTETQTSGQLRVATVTGAAGLGKTRLLAEVFTATSAVDQGIEIIGACCSESDAPDDISVVAQLLRRRFQVAMDMPSANARDRVRSAIKQLVEPGYLDMAANQLGYLMGLDIPQLGDGAPNPNDRERYEMVALSTCFNLMAFHARQTAQVFVFHRAQHLTRGARSFLGGMVAALAETPTLILLLGDRPLEPDIVPGMGARVDIALEPLAFSSMVELVQSILQHLPTPPDELISHIVNRSAGNPRLVEDNIRLLVQKGILVVRNQAWSLRDSAFGDELNLANSHQAVSTARLAGLTVNARHVLSLAAVFGSTFWFEGVLSLLRAQPGNAPELDTPWITDPMASWLEDVLDEARSNGLVALHETSTLRGQHEFTFKGLTDRDALYENIAAEERAIHHRLAAQWLASLPLDPPAPWHGVIAEHWEAGEQPVEAARWFGRAADGAREAYDLRRAKALYQRALTHVGLDHISVLLPILEGFAEASFTAAEFDVARRAYRALIEASLLPGNRLTGARGWLMLGRTYRCLGEYGNAHTCLEHAVSLYRQTHSATGLADAFEQRGILIRLVGADGACDEALALFEQCLEIRQRDGSVRAVAKSLENIASTHLQQGLLAEAQKGLEQSLELREQLGDVAGQAGPLGNMGLIRHAQGDVTGAIEAWRSGLAIAEQVGDRELVGIFFNNIGEGYFELGEHSLAMTALTHAQQIAMETGDQRTLADVLRNLGALALAKGDWERGLTAVDEAIQLSTQMGSNLALGQAMRTRGEILGHQLYADNTHIESLPEETSSCFKGALSIFEDMGDRIELERTLHSYSRFLADRGEMDAAREVLARARSLKAVRESSQGS